MNLNSVNKLVSINLNIGDQLTPVSCGHVVVEIIKFMTYQRLQIPYTYQWLKSVVTKKKNCDSPLEKESFKSETYFRTASTALENLDFILKSLIQEINSPTIPEEICLIFGSTPGTCKEIYRIILPTKCHKIQCHANHVASDQKIQRNVFRTLVTSDTLNQVLVNPLPPTNLFVFLKKTADQVQLLNNNNYVMATGCRIPKTSKVVVINMRSENNDSLSCCYDFKVFSDIISSSNSDLKSKNQTAEDEPLEEIESTDIIKWYQSVYVMKGFKDCVVNGSSIANSWLDL